MEVLLHGLSNKKILSISSVFSPSIFMYISIQLSLSELTFFISFTFSLPSLSIFLYHSHFSNMAAFSYQPFLLDSILVPNTSPLFSRFCNYDSLDQVPFDLSNNELSEQTHMNFTDQSSSVATYMTENCVDQVVTKEVITNTMDKKRKSGDGVSSTNCVQLKDGREVKCKRPRRRNNLIEDSEGNKIKTENKDKRKVNSEEAPSGYIHVRARRGQATDSHSLAERVRREKISERMKVLKTLVPGCDKVTAKAHMLDEIINYVQSLQHQVEFLSMRLASLNPTLYDFGVDFDALKISPVRLNKMVSSTLMPNVENYNFPLPTVFSDAITPSYSHLLPEGQTTTFMPVDQENGQVSMDVDDNRQKLANQSSSYQLQQLVGFPFY